MIAGAGLRAEVWGFSRAVQADVDALVSAATADLTDGGDEPIWRLADRLAQLIDGDPDRVGLAADWLDVLLRREGR